MKSDSQYVSARIENPSQRLILVLSLLIATLLLLAAQPSSVSATAGDGTATTTDTSDHNSLSHRRLGEQVEDNEEFLKQTLDLHLPMFQSSEYTVIGPTSFPKPSAKAAEARTRTDEIVNYFSPTFGTHRYEQDAVLLFAAEYNVNTYILFLSTLRETGYSGDVVLAISKLDWADQSVRAYLSHDPHVIVYVAEFTCLNAENEAVDSMKGGIRVCQCHNLYGRKEKKGDKDKITPLQDPRPARTVPTTRYELYWIWTTHYSKHSWLMLIDARDSVFQTNPFDRVPREPDPNRGDGLLFFFGENIEATRIGLSKKNRKWLTHAYGESVANALQDKPTICSGSTMGEQVAIETYLRAMVGESDETGVKLMGADQGFHNYLHYSNKLANAKTIRSILVQDQGSAIINNLGALRTKELEEWGNGKLVETRGKNGNAQSVRVLNWNGEVSPVVHQFDRHKLLSIYWYKKKTSEYRAKWDAEQRAQKR